MSNSPLVSYTKISPNKTVARKHAIDTVTIHCVVGQLTVETLGSIFADPARKASSNYGIGVDGRIGMYVEEKDRSWCTSNADNDNRAVTIEVASDTAHPYAVNDRAYNALISLLADICMRNKIYKLIWKGDKSLIGQPDKQNMTVHRWFANKSCPGEYLYSRHAQIAAAVNERLQYYEEPGVTKAPVEADPVESKATFSKGDVVSLSDDAKYYNGTPVGAWVKRLNWIVKSVSGNRVVIDKSADGKYAINSPVDSKYLSVVTQKTDVPYLVKVDILDLNIRKGPGTNYDTIGMCTGKGVFTIVEEQTGKGSVNGWGKLKSGAGWVSLDYAKRV